MTQVTTVFVLAALLAEGASLGESLAAFFPRGIASYALGGAFIGLGVATVYVATGHIVGASSFLESTLSYVSGLSRFQRYVASRDWRVLFTVGIVAGAAVYALTLGDPFTTDVQWWRLLGGGVLVGIGTRVGKGCTSGHGVCGVGSLSEASIVNVVTFVGLAIGTAAVVAALGISP